MIKLRLTLDERELAAALAHADDNTQAAFIQTFMGELRKTCDTNYTFQMQLSYIAGLLSDQDREDLTILGKETR